MVVDSGYYFCVVEFVCFSSLSYGCEGSLDVWVIVGSDGNVGFLGLRFSFYYFLKGWICGYELFKFIFILEYFVFSVDSER